MTLPPGLVTRVRAALSAQTRRGRPHELSLPPQGDPLLPAPVCLPASSDLVAGQQGKPLLWRSPLRRGQWRAPLILIDGPSGSGKTSLARALNTALSMSGRRIRIIEMDLFYPGWEGLDAGIATIETLLTGRHDRLASTMTLPPWSPLGHRVWDWQRSRADRCVLLDPTVPVLVEGCGAITPRTHAVSALSLWVHAVGGEQERHERANARDAGAYEQWWTVWARQEDVHLQRDRPDLLADLHIHT